MVDSSLCTRTYNESQYENHENTKKVENNENTKTQEKINESKTIENDKTAKTTNDDREEDRWSFLGRRNEKLEFAYYVSRLDDTSLQLLAAEDQKEQVSSDKFTTLKCIGKLNGQSMEMMLDTGATVSLIRTSLLRKLPNQEDLRLRHSEGMSVRVANGAQLYSRGAIDLEVDIAGVKTIHEFLVFDEVPFNAILGMDYIFKSKWIVDIPNGKLRCESENAKADLIIFKTSNIIPSHYIYLSEDVCLKPWTQKLCKGNTGKKNVGGECYYVDGLAYQERELRINVAHGYGVMNEGRLDVIVGNFGNEEVLLPAGTAVGLATRIEEEELHVLVEDALWCGPQHVEDLRDPTLGVEEMFVLREPAKRAEDSFMIWEPTRGVDDYDLNDLTRELPTRSVDDGAKRCIPTKRVDDNHNDLTQEPPTRSVDDGAKRDMPTKRVDDNDIDLTLELPTQSVDDGAKDVLPTRGVEEYKKNDLTLELPTQNVDDGAKRDLPTRGVEDYMIMPACDAEDMPAKRADDLFISSIESMPVKRTDDVVTPKEVIRENLPSTNLQNIRNEDFTNFSFINEFNFDDMDLTPKEIVILKKTICKYAKVFEKPTPQNPAKVVGHSVDTGQSKPINQVPYRAGFKERQVIEEHVNKMLDDGVISESKSPWASPVVLVSKKDGSIRFCVDYRKLNAVTMKDVYPIPRIDDSLNALGGMKYFSTFDLAQGYWQTPMEEDSKAKTAFTTHCGLYQFNVMPFGLCNAPATFQRSMDLVLAGIKWKSCLVYIDDIIVFSKTFEEHIAELEELFTRLNKFNLKLKASKCFFCKKSVEYLGHVVSKHGIQVDQKKVRAAQDLKPPQNVTEVKSFLGLTGYYRRFIRNYAKIAEPLTSLTRTTKSEFDWNEKCDEAFENLKAKLIEAPILRYPDFNRVFKIQTDASDAGLGAVLSQEFDDGEAAIVFASRTLHEGERKWSTREKEALAVIWACELFRPYIIGQKFIVETDHESLKWLLNSSNGGRIARWNIRLQEFDMEIRHRKGKQNANADAFSRNPGVQEDRILDVDETMNKFERQVNAVEVVIPKKPKKTVIPSIEEFAKLQKEDLKVGRIVRYLECKTISQMDEQFTAEERQKLAHLSKFYGLRDDGILIHYQTFKRHGISRRVNQIVVPEKLIDTIMYYYHDNMLSAHPGIFRTQRNIQDRFYFDGMLWKIKRYVKRCLKCNQHKYSQPKSQGLMQIFASVKPFDVVGIDIVGPFKISNKGNKYILVMMDHFTRWVELRALPEVTAQAVCQALFDEIICRHGCPEKILSDQGQQFVGDVMKELCEKLGIKKIQTSPYHPQTNAHVERFNRYLVTAMRMYVDSTLKNWDEQLSAIAFAYRTGYNASTGDTPYYLIHGRNPKMPTDVELNYDSNGFLKDKEDLVVGLKRAIDAAREMQRGSIEKNKRLYDGHQKEKIFAPGTLVMLYYPNKLLNKLSKRCTGPYRVLKQLSPVTYEIEDLRGSERQIVHVQRIKEFMN